MTRALAADPVTGATVQDGRLKAIYRRLLHRYGPQYWWPAAHPFEMMVGAILTQATAWVNVERAMERLAQAGFLSPQAIAEAPLAQLEELVRPSGYFRMKARKLKRLAVHMMENYRGEVAKLLARPCGPLRQELLSIYGIGPETADCILLYAAQYPVFVIDAYTLRAGSRLGLFPAGTRYDEAQTFFHQRLPHDPILFGEYHALWVELGKELCRPKPACHRCPLLEHCPFGQARQSSQELAGAGRGG